jgi:hypothetical protein
MERGCWQRRRMRVWRGRTLKEECASSVGAEGNEGVARVGGRKGDGERAKAPAVGKPFDPLLLGSHIIFFSSFSFFFNWILYIYDYKTKTGAVDVITNLYVCRVRLVLPRLWREAMNL